MYTVLNNYEGIAVLVLWYLKILGMPKQSRGSVNRRKKNFDRFIFTPSTVLYTCPMYMYITQRVSWHRCIRACRYTYLSHNIKLINTLRIKKICWMCRKKPTTDNPKSLQLQHKLNQSSGVYRLTKHHRFNWNTIKYYLYWNISL